MRSYRRNTAKQRSRGDGSFWLSFSDLMSSLVLIIILVMFYIIYQYFNLAELNEAEIARREYQLDVAQTQLEQQQTKLSDAEKQMISQQILLEAQQTELEAQQAELQSKQSALDSKQGELDSAQSVLQGQRLELALQKTELENTRAQLDELDAQLNAQKAQLSTQQTQLTTQQSRLEEQEAQLKEQEAHMSTQQSRLEEQEAQLLDQQYQIEQLVGMKTRIITSLSSALRSNNINASVDPVTGSIALESDVLFSVGAYDLTAAGKNFVDKFLPVYLDVLFSDEYKEYVSEIIIEGHTDSQGGYLLNLELSQQRALAVASYVLGNDCRAVSPDMKNELRPVVTVNGRSFSDRIFNENGTENRDASRRVVFKFRLTDEQMIQQLRQILEAEQFQQ